MSTSARFEFRKQILQSKGWYAPIKPEKERRWYRTRKTKSGLSKGQRKHIRQKLAQERIDQIVRAQEERVRARAAQVPKKGQIEPRVFATRPAVPPTQPAMDLGEFWDARWSSAPWTCYALIQGEGTCFSRNAPNFIHCRRCNAKRPGK